MAKPDRIRRLTSDRTRTPESKRSTLQRHIERKVKRGNELADRRARC